MSCVVLHDLHMELHWAVSIVGLTRCCVLGMFPLESDDVVVLVCGVHRCWYGFALFIICRCRVRCMGCACVWVNGSDMSWV